jgi:hypothetical protein
MRRAEIAEPNQEIHVSVGARCKAGRIGRWIVHDLPQLHEATTSTWQNDIIDKFVAHVHH